MSASQSAFQHLTATAAPPRPARYARRRPDLGLLLGLSVACAAALAAAAWTGVGANYFLQPRGAAIVLGGSLGVLIITTPGLALLRAARRVFSLFLHRPANPHALVEEILRYSRAARFKGLAALEEAIPAASDPFLRESLYLALEVESRAQLQEVVETRIRVLEREGEADARTLEIAGSFAPTLGILGTVVGLIDVLRDFSNLSSVGLGIGTAFVATMYGLGLANLVLLPAAHRIRARVAETFELHELILEGVLCLFDQSHPALARRRLEAYLRPQPRRRAERTPPANATQTQTL